MRFIANKDKNKVVKDLKMVYRAPSEKAALYELDNATEELSFYSFAFFNFFSEEI